MASKTASDIRHLPVELTDYIIDFLWDEKLALTACSLVCHNWLPAARFHLFHSITVHQGEYEHVKISSFVSFLKSNPTVANRITILRLRGECSDGWIQLDFEHITDILAYAPHIRTLALCEVHPIVGATKESLVAPISSFSSVRHLVLDCVRLYTWSLPPLLSLFPKLDFLYIAHIDLYRIFKPRYLQEEDFSFPLTHLRTLVCVMDGFLSSVKCVQDLQISNSTFANLEIVYVKVAFLQHDSADLYQIVTSPAASRLSALSLDFSAVEDFHECFESYAEDWSSNFATANENIRSIEFILGAIPPSVSLCPPSCHCFQKTQWKSALSILQPPIETFEHVTFSIVLGPGDDCSGISIMTSDEWSRLENSLLGMPRLQDVTIQVKGRRDTRRPYLPRSRKMVPQLEEIFLELFARLSSGGKLRFA